jgi:hypothetical protein
MAILPQLLGIKVRDNFIEDFGGAILDRVALPLTVVSNSIARSNVGTLETDAHAAWGESIAAAARETTTALGLSSNAQ